MDTDRRVGGDMGRSYDGTSNKRSKPHYASMITQRTRAKENIAQLLQDMGPRKELVRDSRILRMSQDVP